MNTELIKQLANNMGISEVDLLCFARSVANSIEQDNCVESLKVLNETDRIHVVEAYVVHANRKMQQFATRYQGCPEARDLFRRQVFELCKEVAA